MLATAGEEGSYDFAFIDADKPNYRYCPPLYTVDRSWRTIPVFTVI